MPGDGESLKAQIVIDNCFLVMLTDFFCEKFACKFAQNATLQEAEKWINQIIGILRQFSFDGQIHCTPGVVNEFIPHFGGMANLRGIQRIDLNHYQTHVRSCIFQDVIDVTALQGIRTIPAAPGQLIGPGGLSDNDLSLVKLAFDLSQNNLPVFILSNDQSLLDFVSWVRIQKKHIPLPINLEVIQGLRCLTYLELIHRSCKIPSDLMRELIEYALIDHYNRTEIAGTKKGNAIFQQLVKVHGNFNQSVVIKQQVKVGLI